MTIRHFLTLHDLSREELNSLIQRAIEMKAKQLAGTAGTPLAGKVLAMIFEKSSTRTRVSFESGMAQLGGHAIFLSPSDSQLGRGEPVADTARVVSRMADAIMVRTFAHSVIEQFAQYSKVPVINGLTDSFHPCQLLADIQTYQEHRGSLTGTSVAWVGDGNNMTHSYINAAAILDFELRIACPEGYEPDADLVSRHKDRVTITRDPKQAVTGANLVVTDTWASMGQEEEKATRKQAFTGYQVDHDLMSLAADDALFMHCLPAYREMEVSDALIEDDRYSVVWDEAENRLHAQKALLEFLLSQ